MRIKEWKQQIASNLQTVPTLIVSANSTDAAFFAGYRVKIGGLISPRKGQYTAFGEKLNPVEWDQHFPDRRLRVS